MIYESGHRSDRAVPAVCETVPAVPVDLCIRRDAAAALFKSQGCQHQPAPLHLRHGSRHVLRPERPFYSLENVGGHTPEKDTPARALPVSPADSGSAGHHGTDVHGN